MNVSSFLEATAKSGKPVTYQDVITAFPSLPPLDGAWNAHPLSRIFEALDQEDAQKKRPFRTSVVIKKDKLSQQPGQGFFEALERLKGIKCRNDAARQSAWIAELKAAFAFTWP